MRFSGYFSGSVRVDGVAYDHDLAAGEAANVPGAAEADIDPSGPVYRYTVLRGCSPVVSGTAVRADGVKKSR